LKRVYTALDLTNATLVSHHLQHHGIPARVFNEHMFAVRLEVPHDAAAPQVWIERDTDYERARSLVMAFENRSANLPDVICHACGEVNPGGFEMCWKCGAQFAVADTL
jgi:hypothetical protein